MALLKEQLAQKQDIDRLINPAAKPTSHHNTHQIASDSSKKTVEDAIALCEQAYRGLAEATVYRAGAMYTFVSSSEALLDEVDASTSERLDGLNKLLGYDFRARLRTCDVTQTKHLVRVALQTRYRPCLLLFSAHQ